MLKLIDLNTVGAKEHRSGWPYCIKSLQPILSEHAPVVFDDFAERTFLYSRTWHSDYVHTSPWVATLHHPPDMPYWYLPNLHLQKLAESSRWQASLPHLRMILSLAPNLTAWCKEQWPDIPVCELKHPTGRPMYQWSPERFLTNKRKRLVQVGWFLRNTAAIYHADVPHFLNKTHLCQGQHWIEYAHVLCQKMSKTVYPDRRLRGHTQQMAQQTNEAYDLLLAENVTFVEVISAAANNAVVESIARLTPICLNRHPGPEFYLGKDYPLFYDRFDQIHDLLSVDNILAAHEYLRKLDKSWIRGPAFMEDLQAACLRHIPECADVNIDAGTLPYVI